MSSRTPRTDTSRVPLTRRAARLFEQRPAGVSSAPVGAGTAIWNGAISDPPSWSADEIALRPVTRESPLIPGPRHRAGDPVDAPIPRPRGRRAR